MCDVWQNCGTGTPCACFDDGKSCTTDDAKLLVSDLFHQNNAHLIKYAKQHCGYNPIMTKDGYYSSDNLKERECSQRCKTHCKRDWKVQGGDNPGNNCGMDFGEQPYCSTNYNAHGHIQDPKCPMCFVDMQLQKKAAPLSNGNFKCI